MTSLSWLSDHRFSKRQSAVDSGSHSNSIWEETLKKVGEPAAEVYHVSHYLIELNASFEDAECLRC